jgi:rod shape-determining protein MreD
LWFPLDEQALQILPLFIAASVLEWVTRLLANDSWPYWSMLVAPFLQAGLWPLIGAMLLVPQRRAFERDDIRPL